MKKFALPLLAIGALCAILLLTGCSTKKFGSTDFNSFTAFTTSKSVSVGTTTTLVLPVNVGRSYAYLQNDSDTVIYLNLTSSSTDATKFNVRLNANGGVYEIDDNNLYLGQIYASSSAVKTLQVVEK